MTTRFSQGHERRKQASRLYLFFLGLATVLIIVFATIVVRTINNPTGPLHTLTHAGQAP